MLMIVKLYGGFKIHFKKATNGSESSFMLYFAVKQLFVLLEISVSQCFKLSNQFYGQKNGTLVSTFSFTDHTQARLRPHHVWL